MNIKSLLLGSAAAVVAATGAQAADAIIAPEPEAVEYVRVCDAYGAGYFYIPGTETCLRIGGYVRYDIKGGDNAYDSGKRGAWDKYARFMLSTHTASETELGTLRTFTETRFNWGNNGQKRYNDDDELLNSGYSKDSRDSALEYAYIDLGGFRVGLAKTKFKDGLGLGDVLQDDVIADGGFTRTGQIAYTFAGSNGFAASIAVEQGGASYGINDYTPHVVGSATFTQGWGQLGAAVAYDSVIKDWSGKVRGSVNVTDQFAVWVMAGFSGDSIAEQAYGAWGGKWAVWGGASYKATDKATLNIQAATEDWGKTSVTANVGYELVSGFKITPEVTWTRFKLNNHYPDAVKKDNVQGMIRFQRSF